MEKCKKFRVTREFMEEQDTPEARTLAILSGIPVVTALMDAPETAVSVAEDVCEGVSRVWGSIFD